MADDTGTKGRLKVQAWESSAISGAMVRPQRFVEVKWKTRSRSPHQAGPLVKDMKIKSLGEISLSSLPTEESVIMDVFMGASLKGEVLKTVQTWATMAMLVLVVSAPGR